MRQGKHRQLQLSPRCLPFLSREQAGSIEPSLKTVNLPCRDSSQRKRSSDVSISGPEQNVDSQQIVAQSSRHSGENAGDNTKQANYLCQKEIKAKPEEKPSIGNEDTYICNNSLVKCCPMSCCYYSRTF